MQDLEKLRAVAASLDADALALVPGANFERALGASFHAMERPHVVIVPQNGPAAAIVPNLELTSFEATGFSGAIYDWRDQDGYDGAFRALADAMKIRRLAVEGQVMRVFVAQAFERAFAGLQIVDAEAEISALRLIKTEAEIQALEKAIAISEAALSACLAEVKLGMTEREVEARLLAHLLAQGAQGLAFDPIVAAGKNSALPHAHAGDYVLQAGDALLFDFGACFGGMSADITRTVFLKEVSDARRSVYETVLSANAAAFAATRPGVSAGAIDDAASAVLEASPFADRIRHKTGHGLGRAVHEAPQIMRGNDYRLEAGVVFTNEPGLYDVSDFGVRIEDDVLVTEDGARNLTQFPKALMVVEC